MNVYAVVVADAPANSSQRILIFGGTFDPPHLAHSKLPAKAAEQLACDQILYIPAAINPLKADTKPTAKEHRLAMLLLAIADVPHARISTIELEREGISFTIDTLRALRKQMDGGGGGDASAAQAGLERAAGARPERGGREEGGGRGGASPAHAKPSKSLVATGKSDAPELYLLMGSDQALDFHRWKDWQEVLALARPAVMLRPPYDRKLFQKQLREKYSAVEAEQWLDWTLRLPKMDISASDIRQRVKRDENLNDLLDPAVQQYIRTNHLYE